MTIYLTTAGVPLAVKRDRASERSRASVGPGPVYSIMRKPRPEYGEAGAGRVLGLTPPLALLEAARADRSAESWAAYEAALVEMWTAEDHVARLEPGRLAWAMPARGSGLEGKMWDGEKWLRLGIVEDGATLVCGCSVAAADAGLCHRVIAARLLAAVGWRVVLDGREVQP